MNFKFLTGDMDWQEYGGKFISKKLNNGDWDYWLVLEVCNLSQYGNDFENTYMVNLHAVAPDSVNVEEIKSACECIGFEYKKDMPTRYIVEALESYGIFAQLFSVQGNNIRELMKQAREEAKIIKTLFGFYMDRKSNMIGNDGWDFISGNIGF